MEYIKPDNIKEAIIQSELYMACKKAGLTCDLQFGISLDQKETGWDLPDLIVVECNQIISIVEVKDYSSFKNLSPYSKNQIERYKKHSVPVFILYSVYDIPYLVKELLEVRKKFLESTDPINSNCFEADRQNKKKWDAKIAIALSRFDEAFPNYKFTNQHSLEDLATGVRVLGLSGLIRAIDESEGKVGDFFFALNGLLGYKKRGRLQTLNRRKNTVDTVSLYCSWLDRIDEKLS